MNLLECCVCLLQYDCENRKPCMGTCGHSICKQCRLSLKKFDCPQCMRAGSFCEETINIELTHILNSSEFMDLFKKKKEYDFRCHKCKENTEDPKVCIDCCLKAGILSSKTENITDERVWNTKEKSPYICIERAESQSMCMNCASENHPMHQLISFKLLKEKIFKQTIDDFNQKFRDFNSSDEKYQNEMKKSIDDSYKLIQQLFKAKKYLPEQQVYAHLENIEKLMKKFTETMSEGLNQLKDLKNEVEEQISFINDNKMVANYKTVSLVVGPCLFHINLYHNRTQYDTLYKENGHSIQIGKKVYYTKIISDENGSDFTEFHAYNIETGKRKYIVTVPGNLTGPITFFCNKLVIVNGSASAVTFNIKAKKLTKVLKFNKERKECICLTYKNELYVIGGYVTLFYNFEPFNYVNSIEKFNEATGKFEMLYYFHRFQNFSAGIEFNDKIYLAGSISPTNLIGCKKTEKVKSFDPINNEWKDEPSFVKPKTNFHFTVFDGVLYAIEEYAIPLTSYISIASVERLDLKQNKWELII